MVFLRLWMLIFFFLMEFIIVVRLFFIIESWFLVGVLFDINGILKVLFKLYFMGFEKL